MVRRFARQTQGTVSLELCLVTPMLLFIFIGIFDMGFLLFQQMEVQAAVDAGATFAVAKGTTNYNRTTVQNVIAGAAYPTQSAITGSASALACACPNSTNTGIVGVGTPAGSPPSCSTLPKCSNGIDPPGIYVLVSATATPTPIFNWPGYPAQVQSGVVVRLQ